jgi:hypothetical protein
MTKAPTANSSTYQGSGTMPSTAALAIVTDHRHGSSKSQVPIGRSARISRM